MEINDSQDDMRYDDNNPQININYFYNLDSENKICFDCGGPFPTCVSINNGVFLCKFCGENHRNNLNYNISFIHEINAPWDDYLLSYATRGGNTRFKRLCLQYEVPCQSLSENNVEKLNKYLIRLGEYNRLLLKSEVNCDEPPPPLYNEVARDPINENTIYFPEFENYQIFKGHFVNKGNDNKGSNSMGNKIWEGTKTTLGVMKTTSGIVYKTGKPIVSFLGKTAFKGLKFVGSSVWNYINKTDETSNKDKITNNNTSQNNPSNKDNFINNFEIRRMPQSNNNNIQDNNNFTPGNISQNNNNNYYPRKNNYYNNPNVYINKKTYIINSSKYNIYTINTKGISNNNINNMVSNPMNNNQFRQKENKDNNIPYFYDINSINNESVNNISFHLNSNNTLSSISKTDKLLEHENIIANQKLINSNNFLINKGHKKYNNLIIGSDYINNKNSNGPNNNQYPSFSEQQNNNDILFRQINDINVPNIIGEEIEQQKGINPILQSSQLLENNSFQPAAIEDNEVKKNVEDSNFSIIPN